MTWPTYMSKQRPPDLMNLLRCWFGDSGYSTVPKRCALCGTPSKGNWITGYYLPCISEGRPEHEEFYKAFKQGEYIELSKSYKMATK